MLGQELVLSVVSALMEAQDVWEKTLLLITYDEHGGFYDHVVPGDHPVAGDPEKSYGVRVPALVVSPFSNRGPCSTVFDHTSILKTILTRFSPRPEEALTAMGPRTEAANDLSAALDETAGVEAPSTPEDLAQVAAAIAQWKTDAYRGQLLEEPTRGESVFEGVSDLQRDIIGNALSLRQGGLVPGEP
jgi:phospholipase C